MAGDADLLDSTAAPLAGERRARLERWLSAALGLGLALRIEAVRRPSSQGGWSNDTLFVDLQGAGAPPLVLRLRPEGAAMFRDYDPAREFRLLQALGRAPQAPPVPRALALEASGEVLGRPFFAMERVAGLVPSDDRPSYAEAGWLFEAAPPAQRLFSEGLVRALAALHAVDWRGLGLSFLARGGEPGAAGELDWLRALHDWGAGERRHPIIERGFAALRADMPAESPPVLLWGDARPANVVARDFLPAALLDWELAGLGPAALDVAWLLEMEWMRTEGADRRRLPGFLSDDEAVALYEAQAGRVLGRLAWYRGFAALKMAVLMERYLHVAIARGRLPAGHRLLEDNVALRRVRSLLG